MLSKNDHLQDFLFLKFSETARKLNQKKKKIISLGLGEPGFKTPKKIIKAINSGIDKGLTKYSNPAGLLDLRIKIAKKLNLENKIKAKATNIVVTNGAKFASMLTFMSLLEPKDEVINITPCYVSYVPQIRIAEPDCKIINVPLDKKNFSLNMKKIKNKISKKTKLVIVNFPHNPTGRILPYKQIKELVKLANKHNFFILSDEVYEKLNFSNKIYFSPASLKMSSLDRIIVVNGFSKSYSMTGYRIGYALFPDSLIKTAIKLQQHLFNNVPAFIQYAAIKALDLPNSFLDKYKTDLKKCSDYLVLKLKKSKKLSVINPQAGFFAFINIKLTKLSSDEFSEKLLSKKFVATIPGIVFGREWDDHVRVSFSAGFKEFKIGVDRILEFVETLIN